MTDEEIRAMQEELARLKEDNKITNEALQYLKTEDGQKEFFTKYMGGKIPGERQVKEEPRVIEPKIDPKQIQQLTQQALKEQQATLQASQILGSGGVELDELVKHVTKDNYFPGSNKEVVKKQLQTIPGYTQMVLDSYHKHHPTNDQFVEQRIQQEWHSGHTSERGADDSISFTDFDRNAMKQFGLTEEDFKSNFVKNEFMELEY